jgi:hypothetical protein
METLTVNKILAKVKTFIQKTYQDNKVRSLLRQIIIHLLLLQY